MRQGDKTWKAKMEAWRHGGEDEERRGEDKRGKEKAKGERRD